MRDEVILNGIVLATSLVGEYDKRLVILTKERGKITAFARGVRKTTNQLISKSQIFVMGEFVLYEGRNAYTLKNVDVKEYFHELTFDMDKYCY
ncbi:MAG: DNA repair protein RecO, partial [Coprococcus sp.]